MSHLSLNRNNNLNSHEENITLTSLYVAVQQPTIVNILCMQIKPVSAVRRQCDRRLVLSISKVIRVSIPVIITVQWYLSLPRSSIVARSPGDAMTSQEADCRTNLSFLLNNNVYLFISLDLFSMRSCILI